MADENKRPLSQAEIKARKNSSKAKEEFIRIHNISSRIVNIQLSHETTGVDFFVGQQSVSILSGKFADFPKSRLLTSQIRTLSKNRIIRVQENI